MFFVCKFFWCSLELHEFLESALGAEGFPWPNADDNDPVDESIAAASAPSVLEPWTSAILPPERLSEGIVVASVERDAWWGGHSAE